MNIFSLLLGLAFLASCAVGTLCLIIAIVKRSWKGAAWTIGGMIGAIASVAGLALLFSSAMDNSLHRQVLGQEVVGVWQLTDWSIDLLKKSPPDQYQPASGTIHQIELRADGTCRYRSLLQMPTRYVDCQGTWSIHPKFRQKDVCELDLSILVNGSSYGFSLDFGEEKNILYLWEYWGDPDSADLLRYEKQPKLASDGNVVRK